MSRNSWRNFFAVFFAAWLYVGCAVAQVIPSGPFGSMNYWGVGGTNVNLAPGLAGQCLTTQGVGSAPVWVNCQVSQLSLLPSINTNQFYGNVSGNFAPPIGVDVNTILNTVGYDIARPPPVEAIIYKSNVGPTFNWQALPPGLTGQVLTSGGPTNPPFWAPFANSGLSGICTTIGAMLYVNISNQWVCLPPGSSGQVLSTGGPGAIPSWLSALPSSITIGANQITGTTAGAFLYGSGGTGINGIQLSGLVFGNGGSAPTVYAGTSCTGQVILSLNASGVATCTNTLANGLTGGTTQQTALNNIMPSPTRAGDVVYYNGTNWTSLAGNNSGSQVLTENSSGVPSWTAAGSGTVTSITPGGGLVSSITASCSQSAITGAGTISVGECVNAQTGTSYAIADSDRGKLITANNAAAQAYTIAQAGAASAFQAGWHTDITNISTNANGIVTITATTSTFPGGGSTYLLKPGSSVRIVSDGTNYQIALPFFGAATKADEQTGTSAITQVTPSQQQSHDSAAKVWVNFVPGASPTLNASYNVTSVTQNATGDYTVNFTTAFASTSFACFVTATLAGATMTNVQSRPTAGSVRVNLRGSTGTLSDPTDANVVCFGRQ